MLAWIDTREVVSGDKDQRSEERIKKPSSGEIIRRGRGMGREPIGKNQATYQTGEDASTSMYFVVRMIALEASTTAFVLDSTCSLNASLRSVIIIALVHGYVRIVWMARMLP
jgi:hypothetical protein